jgi:drug/metabolite transporter (DMT)-like permease
MSGKPDRRVVPPGMAGRRPRQQTRGMAIPTKVLGAGLAVVVTWASAFPAIRVAAPDLGVIGLSVVRLSIAALALLVVAPFAGVRRPERRQAPRITAAGFLGMTAYQLLVNAAELHVPAGTASIVVSSSPLISVAVAVLTLGERLTLAKVAGSAVALAGLAAVCLSRSGVTFSASVWLAVGAAVVQGCYPPLLKPLLRTRSPLEVTVYTMVSGAAMALPLLPFGSEQLLTASAEAWRAAVYLGLVPSALGFVLWAYAVAHLPVATSTSLQYLVPAFALVIAYAWLGEVPRVSEVLGGLVVVAGVGIVTQGDRRRAGGGRAAAGALALQSSMWRSHCQTCGTSGETRST